MPTAQEQQQIVELEIERLRQEERDLVAAFDTLANTDRANLSGGERQALQRRINSETNNLGPARLRLQLRVQGLERAHGFATGQYTTESVLAYGRQQGQLEIDNSEPTQSEPRFRATLSEVPAQRLAPRGSSSTQNNFQSPLRIAGTTSAENDLQMSIVPELRNLPTNEVRMQIAERNEPSFLDRPTRGELILQGQRAEVREIFSEFNSQGQSPDITQFRERIEQGGRDSFLALPLSERRAASVRDVITGFTQGTKEVPGLIIEGFGVRTVKPSKNQSFFAPFEDSNQPDLFLGERRELGLGGKVASFISSSAVLGATTPRTLNFQQGALKGLGEQQFNTRIFETPIKNSATGGRQFVGVATREGLGANQVVGFNLLETNKGKFVIKDGLSTVESLDPLSRRSFKSSESFTGFLDNKPGKPLRSIDNVPTNFIFNDLSDIKTFAGRGRVTGDFGIREIKTAGLSIDEGNTIRQLDINPTSIRGRPNVLLEGIEGKGIRQSTFLTDQTVKGLPSGRTTISLLGDDTFQGFGKTGSRKTIKGKSQQQDILGDFRQQRGAKANKELFSLGNQQFQQISFPKQTTTTGLNQLFNEIPLPKGRSSFGVSPILSGGGAEARLLSEPSSFSGLGTFERTDFVSGFRPTAVTQSVLGGQQFSPLPNSGVGFAPLSLSPQRTNNLFATPNILGQTQPSASSFGNIFSEGNLLGQGNIVGSGQSFLPRLDQPEPTKQRTPEVTINIPNLTNDPGIATPRFDFGFGRPRFRFPGILPGLGFSQGRKRRVVKGRKFKRRPSLVAFELGIFSDKPVFGEETGLVTRPIVRPSRKRRKK